MKIEREITYHKELGYEIPALVSFAVFLGKEELDTLIYDSEPDQRIQDAVSSYLRKYSKIKVEV